MPSNKRVIILLGQPEVHEEDAAAEAITPGHLVGYNGSGNVVKHATAGGNAARIFALHREEMGKDIDQAYASGDYVKLGSFHQGCRVNALIASGVNVIKGDFMESAGDGTLRKLVAGVPIAISREVKNVTALARLTVEII